MSPLRIVIADDESEMRGWFQETLTYLGHHVAAAAENGRQLVDYVREHQPDLVVTDLRMPEMDGLTAAREMKKHASPRVIIVSAHRTGDPGESAAGNVCLYLTKPIRLRDLKSAIAEVFPDRG